MKLQRIMAEIKDEQFLLKNIDEIKKIALMLEDAGTFRSGNALNVRKILDDLQTLKREVNNDLDRIMNELEELTLQVFQTRE